MSSARKPPDGSRPPAEVQTDPHPALAKPASLVLIQIYYDPRQGTHIMTVSGPVLGIETSCDETAAAILGADGTILAETVLSQFADHAPYGGVVPEIAARAHLKMLSTQVNHVLHTAGLRPTDLAAIAATTGPGLIGGLIVGAQFGKGMALAAAKPFIAINHLEAHALTARLPGLTPDGAPFPYLLMLLSGGHSQCIAVTAIGEYQRLGTTVDDAAGEAFDKVAKLLGLGWPGGPALERLAQQGNPQAYAFPRPMRHRPGCDFSFSGLKTAVAQAITPSLTDQQRADLAASFQQAVTEVMADRASHAMTMMRERHPEAHLLVAAGGVAANLSIRTALTQVALGHGFTLVAPPIRLCSDNAVMVAWAGMERLRLGLTNPMDIAPRPRWPLSDLAAS
jgi:N6-L-threonylcarbamoyladenine synthase